MTLSLTGPRTVGSDAGFEVEEHFPDYLEYREGGREYRISAEMSPAPGTSILLYYDALDARWQPPHREDPLDAVTVRMILVRVVAAMQFLRIRADWQTLPPGAEREDWAAIESEARALLPRARSRTPMDEDRALLERTYRAFNTRDMDAVLAAMYPEVDWPNGMDGGRVRGHAAVREYWTRQWALIDPQVEPCGFTTDDAGRIVVEVHQVVRTLDGSMVADRMVQHVYIVQDGLIMRMDIRE
jgi:hypothetical protein